MDTPEIDKLTLRRARVRTRGQHLTAKQRAEVQDAFLAAYSQGHSITKSCKAVGISRETLYIWKEHDEPFMLRFNQAKEEGDDVIRDEIYRRGVEGWEEPVYQLKVLVGTVRRYSDQLLERLAKARMPEYRDKQQVEVSGQLDINTLAAEADARFYSFLAASTTTSVLGEPDGGTES